MSNPDVILMKCEKCGKELKDPFSSSHINSQFHQRAIGGVSTPKPRKQKKDGRVDTLERQMKVVLDKLSILEGKISKLSSPARYKNTGRIKSNIRSLMMGRRSMNFDELASRLDASWNEISSALNELVDEEVYDLAEGRSTKKLNGTYAQIIKR